MSQLIPVPELIRKLKLHKQYKNLRAIAEMGEISYEGLRAILRNNRMSPMMHTLLSAIVMRLDRGEVRFHRNNYRAKEHINQYIIDDRPAGAPQVQRRIVKACDYSKWARCNACGDTHFSPIRRTKADNEKLRYYACDGCVDRPERIMMGQHPQR